jgi:hypothetical protein
MANEEHLAWLKRGVAAWNRWRQQNPGIVPDLRGAELSEKNFRGINLQDAELRYADLVETDFSKAILIGANCFCATLSGAILRDADFSKAILTRADLTNADCRSARFSGACLSGATLHKTNLTWAHLCHTKLPGATLTEADLSAAHLIGANLSGADLTAARLLQTYIKGATFTRCKVYGIAVWGIEIDDETIQTDLVITMDGEPMITVDNLQVAQFVYLLLNNEKIREFIDTITSKAVLILGRFNPPERKAVLDAIREELRQRNYLPILFDFETSGSRDFTETISTLAHMARFIIADLTEPSSLPKELEAIVPTLAVPVQPVLEGITRPYSMFQDYWKYHWVLKVHRYEDLEGLIASLGDRVISPAEIKVKELEETRKAITEELLKQRPV